MDQSPNRYQTSLRYFVHLPKLKRLILNVSDKLIELQDILLNKIKVKWDNILKLEIYIKPRWFNDNIDCMISVALKNLFQRFPSLKNLEIHITDVDLSSLHMREYCNPASTVLRSRYKKRLTDVTRYTQQISLHCKKLEKLQITGGSIKIKDLWISNSVRLGNQSSNFLMFPRLYLLEIDKCFYPRYYNKEFEKWKQKHLNFCIRSLPNCY